MEKPTKYFSSSEHNTIHSIEVNTGEYNVTC